jgi:Adenylate and Guanylate cyclase catalytic domain
VTHVVGHRNPRYSVIGDVVNTASRMESNSSPGRVTTSRFRAEILQKQFPEVQLKSRGKVLVKGKGKMTIYWVEPPVDFKSGSVSSTASDSYSEDECGDAPLKEKHPSAEAGFPDETYGGRHPLSAGSSGEEYQAMEQSRCSSISGGYQRQRDVEASRLLSRMRHRCE